MGKWAKNTMEGELAKEQKTNAGQGVGEEGLNGKQKTTDFAEG